MEEPQPQVSAQVLKDRQHARNSYFKNGGKLISSIKYYKSKYRDDPTAMSILQDTTISRQEKVKRIKKYNLVVKLNSI